MKSKILIITLAIAIIATVFMGCANNNRGNLSSTNPSTSIAQTTTRNNTTNTTNADNNTTRDNDTDNDGVTNEASSKANRIGDDIGNGVDDLADGVGGAVDNAGNVVRDALE